MTGRVLGPLLAGGLLLCLAAASPVTAEPAGPLDAAYWQDLLRAHAGRPTIVHFWGVTCGPCRTELPDWGDWSRRHPDLAPVMVEADPIPVAADRAAALLSQAGLGRAELWTMDALDDPLRVRIDPDWDGELPMTLLIAPDGTATRIAGVADFTVVDDWLGRLHP